MLLDPLAGPATSSGIRGEAGPPPPGTLPDDGEDSDGDEDDTVEDIASSKH